MPTIFNSVFSHLDIKTIFSYYKNVVIELYNCITGLWFKTLNYDSYPPLLMFAYGQVASLITNYIIGHIIYQEFLLLRSAHNQSSIYLFRYADNIRLRLAYYLCSYS